MKKLIFTLSIITALAIQSFGQANNTNNMCAGGSGPQVCTPSTTLVNPGLSPLADSLPPVVDGVLTTSVIEFKNYDTTSFGGTTVTIDSLAIDTISNLPAGLCWATSSSDNSYAPNTFANQQSGCIAVTGTTNADPGQYKLNIAITAYIHGLGPFGINADAEKLYYFVRVNCSDSARVIPVDTTQTAANPYINTGYTQKGACNTGVNTVDANIQSLSVYPNPFTSKAVITFNSIKTGSMTEKITSVIGTEVYRNQINVVAGQNSHTVNRNNLAAGVYIYSISDGTSTFSQRLVITE